MPSSFLFCCSGPRQEPWAHRVARVWENQGRACSLRTRNLSWKAPRLQQIQQGQQHSSAFPSCWATRPALPCPALQDAESHCGPH